MDETMKKALRIAPACFGLLVAPQYASSQQVTALVFDTVQSAPLTDGFIVLVDSTGREVARTLNDQGGLVAMRAPAAGRYGLRYERVGYRSVESAGFELRPDESRDEVFNLAVLPLAPVALRTGGGGGPICGDPALGNGSLAALWEEIRKALAAVSWLEGRERYLQRAVGYQRTLDQTTRVVEEETTPWSGFYQPPRSAVAPSELASGGYIGSRDGQFSLHAPDAATLRHESFLESHCFSIARDGAGSVGIAFAPREDVTVSGVRGTLWVDEESWELHTLEYGYVNAPSGLDDERIGGTVEFAPLATGPWIAHRWEIRLPLAEQIVASDGSIRFEPSGEFRYTGADVLEIIDLEGIPQFTAGLATLAGTVLDSTVLADFIGGTVPAPFAGAEVVLDGTSYTATTDEQGRFMLSASLAGEYDVTFYHPRLDSMGYAVPSVAVSLRPGDTTTVELRAPNLSDLLWSVCPDPALRGYPHIAGVVRDLTGNPVPGAEVFVSAPSVPEMLRRLHQFNETDGMLLADERGRYLICGAIPRSGISLRAAADGGESEYVTLMFVQGGVWRAGTYNRMLKIVWAQDLVLWPSERLTAGLRGVVIDSVGQGVALADVRLLGTDRATKTDSSGIFSLTGLASGHARLEVRSIGHRVFEREVQLFENGTVTLDPAALTLEPLPVRLADIVIEADAPTSSRNLADFEERRQSGQGEYLTRAEFSRRGNPLVVSDILFGMRGIRIRNRNRVALGTGREITSSRGAATFAGACNPSLFLDNMYLGSTADTDIDIILNVEHIEAVEVYTGNTVPPRFNRGCGAIIIWTR